MWRYYFQEVEKQEDQKDEKPHHWSWNTGTERPAVQREQPRSQVKGEGLKWLITDSAAPKLSIR